MDAIVNTLTIRHARRSDLPAMVALFADDALGGHGDTTDPDMLENYVAAFERIQASANDTLYVAEMVGIVVGTFQTTLLTSLPGRGSSSLLVEAVQTRKDRRGQGIGETMIRFAIDQARHQGLAKVQLTSNAARTDAHRFYKRLGFEASHLGFKLRLK
ncbi:MULTISPECIES: GNAT family N-acetyltransferase [unclassified Rhizobium]|uniref:GNAT family N-acetyltransferase n=1 Tax=unclassified Rhizobium TaxID=2613769 RepID=UPI0006F35B41|nr:MULTISPECIES: GNAT family N-acetyltransferase [unclassified Rhizobium]KQV34402.1 acetyltransferase [Rhizobium sp. Root1212]KRD23780.1 acetyltransferase [Rhizobium sp. Root268]